MDPSSSSPGGIGGGEGKGAEGKVAGPWNGAINPQHAAACRTVFGTIKVIRDFTTHLLADLKDVLVDPHAKIGPVFVKHAPFLRIYLSYYEVTMGGVWLVIGDGVGWWASTVWACLWVEGRKEGRKDDEQHYSSHLSCPV
jgi:hypothetical protein